VLFVIYGSAILQVASEILGRFSHDLHQLGPRNILADEKLGVPLLIRRSEKLCMRRISWGLVGLVQGVFCSEAILEGLLHRKETLLVTLWAQHTILDLALELG